MHRVVSLLMFSQYTCLTISHKAKLISGGVQETALTWATKFITIQ